MITLLSCSADCRKYENRNGATRNQEHLASGGVNSSCTCPPPSTDARLAVEFAARADGRYGYCVACSEYDA